jgi:hypothetical protein
MRHVQFCWAAGGDENLDRKDMPLAESSNVNSKLVTLSTHSM